MFSLYISGLEILEKVIVDENLDTKLKKNPCRLDGQITFELFRSCQMFTGPASQTTLKVLRYWVKFKIPYHELK